jgi:pyruvate/2-oxoacid:ferredoxin oxidoreductase alpha subunit
VPKKRHGFRGGKIMKQVLEGSHAVAEAVKLAKVQVISAYPITPQTHIVEALSEFCTSGELNARFLCVESEHSAMAAVIGASNTGVRTFTATSSHGLALMHELLHWASGARLPIVMAEVNRALAPGWNIWMDQTDSLAQRDTGWIQLYCEDGQEVLDTTLVAFRLAETVNLPVMVVLDAFFLSHTYEPVDVPDQKQVDEFLPPYAPRNAIDTKNPFNCGQITSPEFYMEIRHTIQLTMDKVQNELGRIENEFFSLFGRKYGAVDAFQCEDADIIMIVTGTAASTCRQMVNDLRGQGEKIGMLKIRLFRPFPGDIIRSILCKAKKIAVVDRNCSFGAGGIFAQETKAALSNIEGHPPVFSYVAGLGGRDITTSTLEDIYRSTKGNDTPSDESIWVGLKEEVAA